MKIIGLGVNNRIGWPGGVFGRFKSNAVPLSPPTASGSLSNQSVQQGTGVVNYSTSGAFTGVVTTYSLTGGGLGITINPATGVVSVDRAVVAINVFSLSVTASNAAGSSSPVGFSLTVTAQTAADYIITNDAEWTALMANSAATLSGKIAEIQGPLGDTTVNAKAFTAPLVVRGGVGGSIRRMQLTGVVSNITFRDIQFQMTGWPRLHSSTVYFNGGTFSGLRFEGCTFRHGYGAGLLNFDTVNQYPEYTRVDHIQNATTTSTRYALTFQDPAATGAWVEFFNNGAANVFYKLGDANVVATASDTLASPSLNSFRSASFNPQTTTHIAVISASGVQSINARTEVGLSNYLADAFLASGSANLVDVVISDCEAVDLSNAFKGLPPASVLAVLIDSRTRRVYQDQSALLVKPGGELYVMRNSFGLPFSRSGITQAANGDARDPHGDIIQHFAVGTGTIGPLYFAGNRHYMQPVRAGVASQGMFISDNNFSPSYDRVFSISDMYLAGAPNGMNTGEAASPAGGVLIYGATVVDPRNITSQTRMRFENVAANQHVYIGKSISVGRLGVAVYDQSLDLTGITDHTTVFSNMPAANTATSRAALESALATIGPAAGMGAAATAGAVDWTTLDHTQVIKWDLVPSGVEWADLTSQAINSLITLPLRRVLNRLPSQAVTPGSGVEWRSTASDGVTEVQAWTTSTGTIQPDQFIQIRKQSSTSGLTAVNFDLTINGFAQSTAVTTVSAVPAVFHTQSGTGPYYRDPANNIPASTTRMEFAANIYPTALPGVYVKLFSQENGSCDVEMWPAGTFRISIRDGANTALFTGATAPTGYVVNQWQKVEFDVDQSVGIATLRNNGIVCGTWNWTPTASPTFQTPREISFLASTAGTNPMPSGWQVEYSECYFTTSGVRTLRKRVSGSAATVNADPDMIGGDAT